MLWDLASGEFTLHDLPGGQSLAGDKVEVVLRRILAKLPGKRDLQDGTRGEALWRTLGGRTGLLAAMERFRRAPDRRVVIAQLPGAYRTALELEVAPDASVEHRRQVRRTVAGDEDSTGGLALDRPA